MTDNLLRRIIALGVICIVALTLYALLFHDIPERNETTLGVVIGFVFGNMVGPLFRAMFGSNEENRELANKAMDAVTTATGKAIPPVTVPGDAEPVLPFIPANPRADA